MDTCVLFQLLRQVNPAWDHNQDDETVDESWDSSVATTILEGSISISLIILDFYSF